MGYTHPHVPQLGSLRFVVPHAHYNALLDIPVEIRFSDYHSVSGAQIPFHVQRFLSNSLDLDIQVASAQLNSGLSASLFNVQ